MGKKKRKLLRGAPMINDIQRGQQQAGLPERIDLGAVRQKVPQAIMAIEKLRESKVVTLMLAEGVLLKDEICQPLYTQLRRLGKVERLDLFLSSRGGQSEIPYRIVTLLRGFAKHLGILIPYRAHSAATHIALGGDEIIMGDMSELGPTDPKRSHPLLPSDPYHAQKRPLSISVQDLRQLMGFVKKEAQTQLTPDQMVAIYQALFQQVHPLALGAIEQSYALSKQITELVLRTRPNPPDDDAITEISNLLSDHYRSHLLLIGWREAKEVLKLPVVYEDGVLWDRMWELYSIYDQLFSTLAKGEAQVGKSKKPGAVRPAIFIDTVLSGVREQEFLVQEEEGPLQIIAARWVEEEWAGTGAAAPQSPLRPEGQSSVQNAPG